MSRRYLASGRFWPSLPLDGTEATRSVDLPVGTHLANIEWPGAGPEFERTLGGVTSMVAVTWTDTAPTTIEIDAAAAYTLTLHIAVEGLGNVFSSGEH